LQPELGKKKKAFIQNNQRGETMEHVFVTFDTTFSTWNVITDAGDVVFYGEINETEQFLVDNADKYAESEPAQLIDNQALCTM